MRLSGVFDTTFAICKRKVANHQHRRVREASKSGLSTFVWVTVGACDRRTSQGTKNEFEKALTVIQDPPGKRHYT